MSDYSTACLTPPLLIRLRAELADLAYDLERQGRLDAADIVMQLDTRLRELADGAGCVSESDVRSGSPTTAAEIRYSTLSP